MSTIDGSRDRSTRRGDERHLVDADDYVHPDIDGHHAVSWLRAPTDATPQPVGAPSTSPPPDTPAADEEPTLSTIDIEAITITSCRGGPTRC